MMRAHEMVTTRQTRTRGELTWLLLAAAQTVLLLIGLALIVFAAESW